MEKIYKDIPDNFNELESYVITNKMEITESLIRSEKCYFYDTCAFRNHMNISNPDAIFEYMKRNSGVVVLTRGIIMEMCSNDGKLWNEHIEYIKKMSEYGIKVIVMFEEDVFDVLKAYCSDVSKINKWLIFAVRCIKSKAGTIEKVLQMNSVLKKEVLLSDTCTDGTLAKKLFKEIRENKTTQDNLGEELIAICTHWLSNIRNVNEYKYIILTDDKKAIPTISKAIKNSEKYQGMKLIAVVTTAKLCALMQQGALLNSLVDVVDILSPRCEEDIIKIYGSEVYELKPSEKSMKISEFATKIINSSITVYS
ncbi:MAG: hypothetical protein IJN92_00020 [Lachnospiraceae bacterium]|nr:hypothetical protein [Lachnospiraceae bacterium]